MAAAAILSLEEFRDAQRRTAVRERLHDRVDAWLNQLEARMEDRTPTSARGLQERTVETLVGAVRLRHPMFTVCTVTSAPPRWMRRCS